MEILGEKSVSHSAMSNSSTPWTVAHYAPPFMEFSRQEYWSGLPFTSSEDLLDLGIEPTSPAPSALKVVSLPAEPPGSHHLNFEN